MARDHILVEIGVSFLCVCDALMCDVLSLGELSSQVF